MSRGPWLKKSTQPGTTTWGSPRRPATRQALGAGRVDAVHQRVGELGERVVDDALQRALLAQVLHRRAADAVGVEDHRLVAGATERLAQAHHARRRLAQHRDPDAVLAERARAPSRRRWTMPAIAAAALSKIGREMPLQPEDVDDGVHHADVALADEVAEAAAAGRARRDEQLRHADRERLHRRRAQQRALGAAQAQHALHAALGELPHDDLAHALAHQRHGRAARAGGAHVGRARARRRARPPRA